jgi:GT2 family glycosyltransferase
MSLTQLQQQAATTTIPEDVPDLEPVRVVELELGQPLPAILSYDDKSGRYYRHAKCLVRLHSHPLGVIDVQLDGAGGQPQQYTRHIWNMLHIQINEHLCQDGLPAAMGLSAAGLPCPNIPPCITQRERFLAKAPFVSVVMPTHERLDTLPLSLHSLLMLHYPRYEVIVVDNAPSTNSTADFVRLHYGDDPRVRYVREERKGVSWARNSGIAVARGTIVAFTDDDVMVDAHWLTELVRAFAISDDVACVTGLVLPLELETSAQIWFEQYGGFSKGMALRVFDTRQFHPKTPLHPYTTGQFGTGASMAFQASFLHTIGGFDPALGGEGPARCGQDIAAFFQVMRKGFRLVYVPSSLLYHTHRRDYTGLRKQIYNYGVGATAYLMKCVLENPWLFFDLITRIPYGLYFILSRHSPKNRKKQMHYPEDLRKVELKGMLYGPLAYLRTRRALRHTTHSPTTVVAPSSVPIAKEHFIQ